MTRYRESVRSLLKERILDAAYERVAAEGWDRLKMTHVATTAGVSRQTLYTEYGSKGAIGQALVMREVERFLTGIQDQLLAHPDDMKAAVTAAIEYTLRTAADNPLLKTILTSPRGGEEDLLAHLTTRSEPLLETATGMLTAYAAEVWSDIDAHARDLAIEAVVRLTVSHLVQPVLPPDLTAERIAEITMRVAGR
ncbi:TetR family transcriptional regulator [Streptomyces sp. NPDC007264]|uniref:TetR family transcriptional regulator n=1 Tax=Streptomyces sp. NPDC007264 TaxID=3364777 RepID=UPI0036DA70D8